MQLIPISEVAAKDDFASIKNISRDDLLAALRIPPQLMGIVPQNAGGFGSIRDAAQVWALNELEPVQACWRRSTIGLEKRWCGSTHMSLLPSTDCRTHTKKPPLRRLFHLHARKFAASST
jgi:hypothetical protein